MEQELKAWIAETDDYLAKTERREMAKVGKWGARLRDMMDFGDAVPVGEVLDTDMIVSGYEMIKTQWGPAVKITAQIGEEGFIVLTWSEVLIDQLKACEDDLPLEGQITKQKRYYTFV